MDVKGGIGFFKEVFAEWQADQAQTLGAALAYYSVFSIGPLLLIAITIAGTFFDKSSVQALVFDQLQHVLGDQGAQAISLLLGHAFKAGSGLVATVIAIGSLIFAAAGLFNQLRTSINLIWKTPVPEKTGLWTTVFNQLVAVVMVAAVGALLLATMVAGTVLMAVNTQLAARLPFAAPLLHVSQLAITFGAVTTLFALLYKYLPNADIHWGAAWKSAAVTAALFTIGEFAISAYLGISAPGSMYGAAGSLLVVLVWVYYSAQVFFLGVEMMKVTARRQGTYQPPPSAPKPLKAPAKGRWFSATWTWKHPSSRG